MRIAIHTTVAVIAALAVLLNAPASAQSGPSSLIIDFEDLVPGPLGPPFSTALTGRGGPVEWVVAQDPEAPSGPKVLTEISRDRTDDRFPLAILKGFSAQNVDLSVRFKAIGGTVDRAAGLVARLQDKDNYYVVRANALEDNVRLYRVLKGKRTQFAGADVKVPSNRWQTLRLRIEGDRFTVLLDGRPLFTASDGTFKSAGGIGLWTKADSQTLFDGLEAVALP